MEPCKHDADFGGMNTVLKGLVKEIYGNGREGLAKTVPVLSGKVDDMNETLTLLSTNISALTKYISEDQGYNKGIAAAKTVAFSAWQKTGIIIASIGGVSMIVFKLIEVI